MSTHIATSHSLAVQTVAGVIVCTSCKIGLPSERSSKGHLCDKHNFDTVNAKKIAGNASLMVQAAELNPHPLRTAYLAAPRGPEDFYAPLQGIDTTTGYRCNICPSCYSSEKGMRGHFAEKHTDNPLTSDELWNHCQQSGTIQIQTLYAGAKTRYYPVSATDPIGELRYASVSATPLQPGPAPQFPAPCPRADSSLIHLDEILESNKDVEQVFTEMDNAFSNTSDAERHLKRSNMNAFIARTKFDIALRNENISMATAAKYSGLLEKRTEQESLVVQDVSKYLLNVPSIVTDIAPSVLHDVNLRGDKEFTVVSLKSVERYARSFARVIICAMRVDESLLPTTVLRPLKTYVSFLSNPTGTQATRNDLLHKVLKTIFLHRLEKLDSPRFLFVRQFTTFASVTTMSRSQTDSFRFADASDISPVLAALLYGASSCALTEIHQLGIQSNSLRNDPSIDQEEAKKSSSLLNARLEDTISSLEESQNSAASFIRKTLTIANSIVMKEDVDFVFDICDSHPLCGLVDNVHIKMKAVGDIVKQLHKDISASFSSLLYGANLPDGFSSHLASFEDIHQDKTTGFSFLTNDRNKKKTRNYTVWLFNQITTVRPAGRAEFSPTQSTPLAEVVQIFGKTVRRKAVQKWLENVQHLQENLLACTHLSSGSPARATELETLQLFNNSHALRNVYISQGRLVVVTRYTKTRSLTGWDKVIPRFPDLETSKLFLTYLVLFRTLECIFLKALHGIKVMKNHMEGLFVDRGASYSASRIRDVIRRSFHAHSIPIEFNHFRHFAAGMVPIITQNSPALLQDELISDARLVAHLQAGHSLQVAEHGYARRPTDLPSLSTTALARYRLFSTEWHRNLGLLPPSPIPHSIAKHKSVSTIDLQTISTSLTTSISENISRAVTLQLKKFTSNLKRPLPEDQPANPARKPFWDKLRAPSRSLVFKHVSALLGSLRHLLKDPNAMFTSETQLHVSAAVCEAREDLMVLMPTGAGKTISFLLPVFLEQSACSTVIIVPLAALVHEHVQTCRNLGISVATWADRNQDVQVYVISIDHNLGDLRSFFYQLQNRGKLRRIVIDEAHLLILWSSFRASIGRLPYALKCRGDYVQIVLLTATLPPYHREKLLSILSIPSVVLYSQPTCRSNLRFSVIDTSSSSEQQRFVSHEKSMTDTLCDKVFQVSSSLLEKDGGRILIFALYKQEAERLQSALQHSLSDKLHQIVPIRVYHAGLPPHVLKDTFDFWKADDARLKLIAATEAFASGIHVDNVHAVFHYGGSNGLLQYAQEAGRAGRGRQMAQCTIIYNKAYAEKHTAKVFKKGSLFSFSAEENLEDMKQEWLMMQDYMTQTSMCRKNQLYAHIDGQGPGMCIFDQASSNCDICDKYQTANVSGQTLLASPPLTPTVTRSISDDLFDFTPQPSQLLPPPHSRPQFSSSPPFPNPLPLPNIFSSSSQLQPAIPSRSSSLPSNISSPNGPLPVKRRLSFGDSQENSVFIASPNIPLNQFRQACHSLQNLCVVCLVFDGKQELSDHQCRHMRNRCRRCFQTGHQVCDCQSFLPRRKNYCYGCSLSQVKGENIHKAGEFGSKCFMRIARDIAWAFWAKDSVSRESIVSCLCRDVELSHLRRTHGNDGAEHWSNDFYDTWLRTYWGGIPNQVRFFLWWYNYIHST